MGYSSTGGFPKNPDWRPDKNNEPYTQDQLAETVEAWADITVEKWKQQIVKLDVINTGALYDDFEYNLDRTGGTVNKVRFLFKGYGLYVNYGVGREITALRKKWKEGEVLQKKRGDKRWYSSVIYREVQKLSKILADKYSKESARTIASRIMKMEQTRRNVIFNTNNFKRS